MIALELSMMGSGSLLHWLPGVAGCRGVTPSVPVCGHLPVVGEPAVQAESPVKRVIESATVLVLAGNTDGTWD